MQRTKSEFIEQFMAEISSSPELKEQFIKDPKRFVESRLNFKIPENFQIAVHEDTPTIINIVIPNQSDELSEIELAAVAGGRCYCDLPDENECPTYFIVP